MKKILLVAVVLAVLCLAVSVANAETATIKITADNYYELWINDTLLGGNKNQLAPADNSSNPSNWGTPETFTYSLQSINTILVKAENSGTYSAGNPAGLLASITTSSNRVVTDTNWSYSYNNVTWSAPSKMLDGWNKAIWFDAGGSTYMQPTQPLYEAFNDSGAKWIWSQDLAQSPVWFRITLDKQGAAVPEPMSIMLGIMGLGSIAGFKRLRRK